MSHMRACKSLSQFKETGRIPALAAKLIIMTLLFRCRLLCVEHVEEAGKPILYLVRSQQVHTYEIFTPHPDTHTHT